jgi:hypothetical protein
MEKIGSITNIELSYVDTEARSNDSAKNYVAPMYTGTNKKRPLNSKNNDLIELIVKTAVGDIYLIKLIVSVYSLKHTDPRKTDKRRMGITLTVVNYQAFSMPLQTDSQYCKTTQKFLTCSVNSLNTKSRFSKEHNTNYEKVWPNIHRNVWFIAWKKPENYISDLKRNDKISTNLV